MTSAPNIEARKCEACGMDMIESRGVYRCVNADGIQPQETQENPVTGEPFPRVKSGWDRLHDKDWAKKIKGWYPGQSKNLSAS